MKITHYISTGLLTLMTVLGIGMYIFSHEVAVVSFTKLGYPTYLIYPLAAAKSLGLIAIWTKKSRTLLEWAYAGFFFDFTLGTFAHLIIGDGEFAPAAVALLLILTSYISLQKTQ